LEKAAWLLDPAETLDFVEFFKETEAQDTQAAAVAAALRLLKRHLGRWINNPPLTPSPAPKPKVSP